jgi:hypothetical protein
LTGFGQKAPGISLSLAHWLHTERRVPRLPKRYEPLMGRSSDADESSGRGLASASNQRLISGPIPSVHCSAPAERARREAGGLWRGQAGQWGRGGEEMACRLSMGCCPPHAGLSETKASLSRGKADLKRKRFLPFAPRFLPDGKKVLPLPEGFFPGGNRFLPFAKRFLPHGNKFLPFPKKFLLNGKKECLGSKKACLNRKKESLGGRKARLNWKKESLCREKARLNWKKESLCREKARLNGKKVSLCGKKACLNRKKESLCRKRARLNGKKACLRRVSGCLSPIPPVSSTVLCFGHSRPFLGSMAVPISSLSEHAARSGTCGLNRRSGWDVAARRLPVDCCFPSFQPGCNARPARSASLSDAGGDEKTAEHRNAGRMCGTRSNSSNKAGKSC